MGVTSICHSSYRARVGGLIERAWALAKEAGRAASPEEFAEVLVDQVWRLVRCDDAVFREIDHEMRRLVLVRSRSVLVRPGVGDRPRTEGRTYRDALWPAGLRFSVEVVFASPPAVRRALVLGRAERDFTDRERDLLALLVPHLEDAYRKARLRAALTRREREVVSLVAEGLTNREIARRLDISAGTVRVHLQHSFPKLGVRSRAGAAAMVR